jgi:hypothetical protein
VISGASQEAGVRLDLTSAGAWRPARADAQGHGGKDAAAASFPAGPGDGVD